MMAGSPPPRMSLTIASLSIASAIASRTRLSARVGLIVSGRRKMVSTVGPPCTGARLTLLRLSQRPISASPRLTIAARTSRSARKDEGHVLDRGGAARLGRVFPHQSGLAVSLTCWPLTHSTNLYGPGADRLERESGPGRLVGLLRVQRREVQPGRQDRVRGLGHHVQGVLVDRLGLELGTDAAADPEVVRLVPL